MVDTQTQGISDDFELAFGEVEKREEFSAITAGTYPALIFGVPKVEMSRTSNQPKLTIEFKITEGEFKERHLWAGPSLQKTALWKLQQWAERLGLPAGEISAELRQEDQDAQPTAATSTEQSSEETVQPTDGVP